MGLWLEMPACSDPSTQSHRNAIETLDCTDSIGRVWRLNIAGTFFSGSTQSALPPFFLVPTRTFYLQLDRPALRPGGFCFLLPCMYHSDCWDASRWSWNTVSAKQGEIKLKTQIWYKARGNCPSSFFLRLLQHWQLTEGLVDVLSWQIQKCCYLERCDTVEFGGSN